jgi:hypothetical protein
MLDPDPYKINTRNTGLYGVGASVQWISFAYTVLAVAPVFRIRRTRKFLGLPDTDP